MAVIVDWLWIKLKKESSLEKFVDELEELCRKHSDSDEDFGFTFKEDG